VLPNADQGAPRNPDEKSFIHFYFIPNSSAMGVFQTNNNEKESMFS
jgi:hypothetical protein